MRILRPTQQCGGLEELKPVDQNLQYDFNYQQFTYLPEEITVYPVSVCVYVHAYTRVCVCVCVYMCVSVCTVCVSNYHNRRQVSSH